MPRNKVDKSVASVNESGTKAYLELDEIARLEKCAANVRDRLLIRLLFYLGCRVSEAPGIAVGDVELAKSTVTIQHLKVRLRLSCPSCHTQLGRSHSYSPKCGTKVQDAIAQEEEHRRVRTLPIDPVMPAVPAVKLVVQVKLFK